MMAEEITKQNAGELLPPEPDKRALNARTHGLTAQTVPPDERESYAQHAQQVREASGAQSYLEQRLADRAALALWRLERVARYEAAQVSAGQLRARQAIEESSPYGIAPPVTKAREVLSELCGLPYSLLSAQRVEALAAQFEGYALTLERWGKGGSAEDLSELWALHLGKLLADELLDTEARPSDLVKAMTGNPARRGQTASLEGGEWLYEPHEVPGLLGFAREFWGEETGEALAQLAQGQRLKAAKIRGAWGEAQAAYSDALALSSLPSPETLEKITRYEAHLERTLYRALHDLEASRREREGKASAPPLRGVIETPDP